MGCPFPSPHLKGAGIRNSGPCLGARFECCARQHQVHGGPWQISTRVATIPELPSHGFSCQAVTPGRQGPSKEPDLTCNFNRVHVAIIEGYYHFESRNNGIFPESPNCFPESLNIFPDLTHFQPICLGFVSLSLQLVKYGSTYAFGAQRERTFLFYAELVQTSPEAPGRNLELM